MKIVVVDDEPSVLNGLRHILAKHCPRYEIVGMVQSAKEALGLLQENEADVVITDVMMPEMNGIELTREIGKRYPGKFVVILSGHDDFEFVRQAMKDGAFDYLLKPSHYQMVLDVLQKIEDKISERDQHDRRMNRKHLLENLIAGKAKLPENWAAQSGMMMAVISDKGSKESLIEECFHQQASRWNMDKDMLETVVYDKKCIVLFRETIDPAFIKRRLYEWRQQLRRQNILVHIAFHSFGPGPDCLEPAYMICKRMIEQLEFYEQSVVMDDEMYAKQCELQKAFTISEYLSGKELGRYCAGTDQRRMRQYIESGLNRLSRIALQPEPAKLKRELLCQLVYLEQVLKEKGSDSLFRGQADYVNELEKLATFSEMMNWLKNFLLSCMMCMSDENQHPHYIQSALQYMEMNYMKDLTLKQVADAVYINPWYFSSQFKKYIGVSFSDYLNQLRIRMAKEFLRQKDLKVYQIAEMVGFQDATYFSTVFKNMENISPKEYQKTY